MIFLEKLLHFYYIYKISFHYCIGENQNGKIVAIKIAIHEAYNQYLKHEIDAYRALNDTGIPRGSIFILFA